MKVTYIIDPDWTDGQGLADVIVKTAGWTVVSRARAFNDYVEAAALLGHTGFTIQITEETSL